MGVPKRFEDRRHAGRVLATELARYARREDVIVLGLPRGGVPVAYEIAKALHVPFDVLVVRKLGMPGEEEYALGAIAGFGVRVVHAAAASGMPRLEATLARVEAKERLELARREAAYRGTRPFPDLRSKTVILVDDGLATGSTMRAAIRAVRTREPGRIVVAVPVGEKATCRALTEEADDVVCAKSPSEFSAVGAFYEDFVQTTDDEVQRLLRAAT
jgi:putative phosphoribosyl transferase